MGWVRPAVGRVGWGGVGCVWGVGGGEGGREGLRPWGGVVGSGGA